MKPNKLNTNQYYSNYRNPNKSKNTLSYEFLCQFQISRQQWQQQQEREWHMNYVCRVYEEQQQEQKLMEMQRKNLLDPRPRDFSRLLSFLEVDNNSFLTPWNWKPGGDVPAGKGTSGTKSESLEKCDLREEPKQYVSFERGSFYAHEVHDLARQEQQTADSSGAIQDEGLE